MLRFYAWSGRHETRFDVGALLAAPSFWAGLAPPLRALTNSATVSYSRHCEGVRLRREREGAGSSGAFHRRIVQKRNRGTDTFVYVSHREEGRGWRRPSEKRGKRPFRSFPSVNHRSA